MTCARTLPSAKAKGIIRHEPPAATSGIVSSDLVLTIMFPVHFRLGIALSLILAVLAYPTAEHEQDVPDPFSDPLDDGPSLYRAWRASREPAAVAWTMQEEQVMLQLGMKRRVEAFANWLNPWGEGQITVFVSDPYDGFDVR